MNGSAVLAAAKEVYGAPRIQPAEGRQAATPEIQAYDALVIRLDGASRPRIGGYVALDIGPAYASQAFGIRGRSEYNARLARRDTVGNGQMGKIGRCHDG